MFPTNLRAGAATEDLLLELGAIELGAIELRGVELGVIELGAIELRGVELGVIELGAIELCGVELGAALEGVTPPHTVPFTLGRSAADAPLVP